MGFVNTATIGTIALYVAFLMAKHIAHMVLQEGDDGTNAGIVSLMCFCYYSIN